MHDSALKSDTGEQCRGQIQELLFISIPPFQDGGNCADGVQIRGSALVIR